MVNSENIDRSVVLGGLPQNITTDKVKFFFAGFHLRTKNIIFNQNEYGVKNGYAIVNLENSFEAQRAITELDHNFIGECT